MPYYCIIYCFTVYINKARNYVIKGAVFFVEVQQSPNASPLWHSSPQPSHPIMPIAEPPC